MVMQRREAEDGPKRCNALSLAVGEYNRSGWA
jgi:hypothetical protein